MESCSREYLNYMPFDEPSPFQTPDLDAGDDGFGFADLNGDVSSQGFGGPQTPSDHAGSAPALVWDGFPDPLDSLEVATQKELFVDPELYRSANNGRDAKRQIADQPTDQSGASTRRTSADSQRTSVSASTRTQPTPPDEEGPEPPRKSRKRKAVDDAGMTTEERAKKAKFLERNRLAASKCRQKKKKFVEDLERKCLEAEARNKRLHQAYEELASEVSELKNRLMMHAGCHDPNIDCWLQSAARRVVGNSAGERGELRPQPLFAFVGAASPQPVASPSRNSSNASLYPPVQYDDLAEQQQGRSLSYSRGSASLYASPTQEAFPLLKRESELNYNPMESMFTPEGSIYGGG